MAEERIPPPLREELKIRKIKQAGETTYVFKEPDKQEYFQFDEPEYEIMALFDGKHDTGRLAEMFNDQSEEFEVDQETVDELVDAARENRLLTRTRKEENAALLERIKEERKKKLLQRKGNLLLMRFHLVNPNEAFNRWIDHIRWLWTPASIKIQAGIIAFAGLLILFNLERFLADFERVFFHANQDPWNFAIIWIVALGAIALHECGHGLTCKNYGGDVDDMGFLLLALQPCLYCNVNDAWLFQEKKHKIFVAFAGIWVELLVAAFAVFVWMLVDVGNMVGRVAYTLVTIGTASSLLFNLNPLVKFDGYYMLTDLVEIQNLRQNAQDLFSHTLKRIFFGVDEEPPFHATRREKRIYMIYGALSIFWITMMLSTVAFMGYGFISTEFGFLGAVIFIFIVLRLVKKLTGTWFETIGTWFKETTMSSPTRKVVSVLLLGLFVTAAALWEPRVHIKTTGEVVAEKRILHAPEGGFVEHIGFGNDRKVVRQGGEPLIKLRSPDLELERNQILAQKRGLNLDRKGAAYARDPAKLRRTAIQEDSLKERLDLIAKRMESMAVPAPAGEWLVDGPPPVVMRGRHFGAGEELLTLIPLKKRRISVTLEQGDFPLVEEGQEGRVRFTAVGPLVYPARVVSVAPAAKADGPERFFEIQLEIQTPEGRAAPAVGMTGEVMILGNNRPLWRHIVRPIRRMLRADLWI